MKHVLIVGGGFAGLNAAKLLGNARGVKVTLIDRRNHHLFQPLLYMVAMAGLSPADIAAPIRSILSKKRNIYVLQGEVTAVDLKWRRVFTDFGKLRYDYLILACGVQHSYFGHEEWEEYAPGLKTLEQATEIRRRILTAFERAERKHDNCKGEGKPHLTFVIIGGGPTGIELAGAIGEMTRFTLSRDFRRIDPRLTRIILIEAGQRILPSFSEKLSRKAAKGIKKLGVEVRTSSKVTMVKADMVEVGGEIIHADAILWAAGVQASNLNNKLGIDLDQHGRIIVEPDLSLKGYPEVFVAGDQANFSHQTGKPLPGLAPVALQQGYFIARNILREIKGRPRNEFRYVNKGQLATIGRGRAVVEIWKLKFGGFFAWLIWLLVHIYYLIGFKNRIVVLFQWAWSYLTFHRGARLIVGKEWRFYKKE